MSEFITGTDCGRTYTDYPDGEGRNYDPRDTLRLGTTNAMWHGWQLLCEGKINCASCTRIREMQNQFDKDQQSIFYIEKKLDKFSKEVKIKNIGFPATLKFDKEIPSRITDRLTKRWSADGYNLTWEVREKISYATFHLK